MLENEYLYPLPENHIGILTCNTVLYGEGDSEKQF